ncbi:hypothetical protein CCYA_CCYA11G3097 [Cyanidiococcus yangmingshanensis]|uniref:Uncharacterized protein n=1 Tax=Cyanidiococcus yangmingshanensis TaxID=2690220 RepID=A0A7J7IGH3_9RHOD|nr:hypothetical protein F1559_002540 [Cyanidiococcus yangmingshanensis]KAK4532240.1 hypothetical protein CCYA_CCYA11G3097 [Cyanidiococcus yangmingshanensis]
MISIRNTCKRLFFGLLALSLALSLLGAVCEAVSSSVETTFQQALKENTELRAIVAQLRELVSAKEKGIAYENPIRLQRLNLGGNPLLRATTATGNGNLVLECAYAGRLLYRFTCGSGGTTASTFTGVATCT